MASPIDFLLGKQPTSKKSTELAAPPQVAAFSDLPTYEENAPAPRCYGGIMGDGEASEFNSAVEAMCAGFVPQQAKR